MLPEPSVTLFVLATFFGAGLVKGLVGLGFPTITVAVLVSVTGLVPAIAVTVVPAIVTNVAQAFGGGHLRALLRRLWPLLASAVPGGLVGTTVLANADAAALIAGLVVLTLGLTLAFGLARTALLEPAWSLLSLAAVVPALAGMELGPRWRRRLDERRFRRVLVLALFALGVHLVVGTGG